MNKVFLSLGSNKGKRSNYLKKAILNIKNINSVRYIKASPVYETKPMYNLDQESFLNMVVQINTSINPIELLEKTQGIERKIGRKATILKNQPRVIDIDILDYESVILNDKELILPHPDITERLFVLKPWSDIAPMHKLPNMKENIYQLTSDMKLDADIIKLHASII